VPLGIAILGRHDFIEHIGFDRLRDAGSHGVLDAPDIDGEQHIRGAVGALGLDALFEARACGDDVDLDAGVPGEGVEQRLDELALAISVDIDIAGLGERGASSSDCTHDHRTTRERANGLHGQSSVATFA
jgi:hypothetical protein